MEKFETLQARAVSFYRANVDTDLIIPARHLKTVSRLGLGTYCFETVRYDADGRVRNSSPFDHGAAREAQILIAGPNFGCGSSREHAVWALMDMGIRAIIAPSFADIFAGNAVKNGLLLIDLPAEKVEPMSSDLDGRIVEIDLPTQQIRGSTEAVPFDIDPFRKDRLLRGLDEIAVTLDEDAAAIDAFEEQDRLARPWLYQSA